MPSRVPNATVKCFAHYGWIGNLKGHDLSSWCHRLMAWNFIFCFTNIGHLKTNNCKYVQFHKRVATQHNKPYMWFTTRKWVSSETVIFISTSCYVGVVPLLFTLLSCDDCENTWTVSLITMKSEVRIISHCFGLSNKTTVCTLCPSTLYACTWIMSKGVFFSGQQNRHLICRNKVVDLKFPSMRTFYLLIEKVVLQTSG